MRTPGMWGRVSGGLLVVVVMYQLLNLMAATAHHGSRLQAEYSVQPASTARVLPRSALAADSGASSGAGADTTMTAAARPVTGAVGAAAGVRKPASTLSSSAAAAAASRATGGSRQTPAGAVAGSRGSRAGSTPLARPTVQTGGSAKAAASVQRSSGSGSTHSAGGSLPAVKGAKPYVAICLMVKGGCALLCL